MVDICFNCFIQILNKDLEETRKQGKPILGESIVQGVNKIVFIEDSEFYDGLLCNNIHLILKPMDDKTLNNLEYIDTIDESTITTVLNDYLMLYRKGIYDIILNYNKDNRIIYYKTTPTQIERVFILFYEICL